MNVPRGRLVRWTENFEARHGTTSYAVADHALLGQAADGSRFAARLPFAVDYAGEPDAAALVEAVGGAVPDDWGLLLVRKGGFAVARLTGEEFTASKVGKRHVQGRTKAGGQSQQRFARRRDNQARQAYEAAADHAARLLGDLRGPLVRGGDRGALDEVLSDSRLIGLGVVGPWLPVPDPRRSVLEQAATDACAIQIEVLNAAEASASPDAEAEPG